MVASTAYAAQAEHRPQAESQNPHPHPTPPPTRYLFPHGSWIHPPGICRKTFLTCLALHGPLGLHPESTVRPFDVRVAALPFLDKVTTKKIAMKRSIEELDNASPEPVTEYPSSASRLTMLRVETLGVTVQAFLFFELYDAFFN